MRPVTLDAHWHLIRSFSLGPPAMRPLLVVLCLVASACAAGLEYGGLTTLLPSPAPSPTPSYALAAPGTELYFAWTVAEPGGSEWYSFSFSIGADTTGLCIDLAPAGQLSIDADCTTCRSVGQQVFMPQPGQWLARITNCLGTLWTHHHYALGSLMHDQRRAPPRQAPRSFLWSSLRSSVRPACTGPSVSRPSRSLYSIKPRRSPSSRVRHP